MRDHTQAGNEKKTLIRPDWVHADGLRPIEYDYKTHPEDEMLK